MGEVQWMKNTWGRKPQPFRRGGKVLPNKEKGKQTHLGGVAAHYVKKK